MYATGLCVLLLSACGGGPLSTEQLIDALRAKGIQTQPAPEDSRSQMQKEIDNMNDAIAGSAAIPKLKKKLLMNGVLADVFFCPGKAMQVQNVVLSRLRGEREGDPAYLAAAADVITGSLDLPFETHIVSLRPTQEQNADVLKIAVALAQIEDR